MKKLVLALLITLMASTLAAADTVYLRDGRTVRGTVLGFINGRFAVRLTTAVAAQANVPTDPQTGQASIARISGEIGDIIFLRTREIERVEIDGRSLDEARYVSRTVEVSLGPNWIDTGVDLRRGERVQVNATGIIVAGRSRIGPGGLRSTDQYAPLPRAAEGVLIGSIGNDANAPIIEIGLSREFIADNDGRLYLTANRSSYADARGAFSAQIRREINLTQRAGNRRNNTGREEDEEFDDLFGTGNTSEAGPVRPRSNTGTGYPADTSNQPTRERTLSVQGTSRGADTGIDLRAGDQVNITATGNVTAGRRAGVVSADGGRASIGGALLGSRPVPNAGVGALIGFIRLPNGQITQPFLVGSQLTFTAPESGRLFLMINDDNYSDNSGSFYVRILY